MAKQQTVETRHPLAFRILHELIMIAIILLVITGFYIHRPFVGGGGFLMVLARGVHFLAAAILIIAVMFLGARELFQERIYLETYLDESVQGLEVGTPVKHRGVQIGNIDQIDFVRNIYDAKLTFDEMFEQGKYVYIRVALFGSAFGGLGGTQAERILDRMVNDGLRVQMAPQGITGVCS